MEESFSKFVDDRQHEWKNYVQLIMVTYRPSIHAVTKYSPSYVVLGTIFKLPIDCRYETSQREILPTPSDFKFKMNREMQRAHHLVRAEMMGRTDASREKTR